MLGLSLLTLFFVEANQRLFEEESFKLQKLLRKHFVNDLRASMRDGRRCPQTLVILRA